MIHHVRHNRFFRWRKRIFICELTEMRDRMSERIANVLPVNNRVDALYASMKNAFIGIIWSFQWEVKTGRTHWSRLLKWIDVIGYLSVKFKKKSEKKRETNDFFCAISLTFTKVMGRWEANMLVNVKEKEVNLRCRFLPRARRIPRWLKTCQSNSDAKTCISFTKDWFA